MQLPTQKSDPDKRWFIQNFLILGQGKIGKSEFFAQGEKTLFLETEPGLNHLSVMKVPVRNWNDMREVAGTLIQEWEKVKQKLGIKFKGEIKDYSSIEFPYDTVVIDTLDRLVVYSKEFCIEKGIEKFPKNKIEAIGDIPNGAGWYWDTNNIGACLAKLSELPCALVLVSHIKIEEITEPTQKYHKKTIAIGGNTGTSILHYVDHTIQVESRYQGDKILRKLRTKPALEIEAGSRGNVVPDGMEWGQDAKENYAAFRKLFN